MKKKSLFFVILLLFGLMTTQAISKESRFEIDISNSIAAKAPLLGGKDEDPVISGTDASICTGSTVTYTATPVDGAWTSSNPAVATVIDGMVTGVAKGTATISYTVNGVSVSRIVTVNLTPVIAGKDTVCRGSSIQLSFQTNLIATGTWVISPAVPGVSVSEGGLLTVAPSVTDTSCTVKFTANGCVATKTIAINTGDIFAIPLSSGSSTQTVTPGTAITPIVYSLGNNVPTAVGLPLGVTINSAGVIQGTPVVSGIYNYTIKTENCGLAKGTITVSPSPSCTPQPILAPGLATVALLWFNNPSTTATNIQKSNNLNTWNSGGRVNRPIADGETISFRTNKGMKTVGLGPPSTGNQWNQPHSVYFGFDFNDWSGKVKIREGYTVFDDDQRTWTDSSVFKIKRVCNKVYYYMDDVAFNHVGTIGPNEVMYLDFNLYRALGWVYNITIYDSCNIPCPGALIPPSFQQIAPVCSGTAFTLPTTSSNGVTGAWSPAVDNTATTTYTFTPDAGQNANTATMTVTVNPNVISTFTPIEPVCSGTAFTLPTTSSNGVTGSWSPSIDNQATTTYTFTPNAGQCATTATITVEVNPVTNLVLTSSNNIQIIDVSSPLQPITYNLENGASGVTVTGLPTGISYSVLNNVVTISGSSASIGNFNYTINTTGDCGVATAQGTITVTALRDWTQAPNSYIFTPNQTKNDGLYIPVGKAYAMWASNVDNVLSINSPISDTQMSAYVYWEDNSGLIKTPQPNAYKLDIIPGATPNLSKIKVLIDKTKGKGNAVVTFHVGANGNSTDPIHWSWHVWVTDDVEKGGSTYRQGYETDKNNVLFNNVTNRDGSLFKFQWMNRNLGATNAEFLGHDWNKSAGLMYQWGRKDPFPGLTYKDGSAYEINGEAGRFVPINFNQNTAQPFGWTFRPNNGLNTHTEVKNNIKYAINNPLRMITFLERYGHWFSDDYFRLKPNTDDVKDIINWDLWGDNRKGVFSNITTTEEPVLTDSKSYELKSPYDPCPCGWRIPSHTGSVVRSDNQINIASPLGKTWGANDDIFNTSISGQTYAQWSALPSPKTPWCRNNTLGTCTVHYLNPSIYGGKPFGEFTYTVANPQTPNVKIYPSLGFDYRNQAGRNLGIMPLTGAYVFTGPNEVADYNSTTPKFAYQNWLAIGSLHLASLSVFDNASARTFGVVGDFFNYVNESKFRMDVNQIAPQKGASPVRCIKDPNEKHLSNFVTEFIPAVSDFPLETLKTWTKDANTHIINPTENSKSVNVRKAFAMQKLYVSDNKEFPTGTKSVSVYWTTNQNLITNVTLADNGIENSTITIDRAAGQYGNAVIALHSGSNGNANDPVIWSWQIWAPETEPQAIPTYTTESIYVPSPNSGIVVNPTENIITAPLKTEFMDRNLGALVAFPTLEAGAPVDADTYKKSIGLHYQWGRKDPIPTFLDQSTIYKGNTIINGSGYLNTTTGFVRNYSQYSSVINTAAKRTAQIQQAIKYSVENPLTYLYQNASTNDRKDWISNMPNIASDRWGHATQKSPYDPCPEGWRVPDTSFSFVVQNYQNPYENSIRINEGVKGNSPWYYGDILDPLRTDGIKGIDQKWDTPSNNPNPIISQSASGVYKGNIFFVSETSTRAGWVFNNANYAIGNYPFAGIRGETNSSVANNFPRVGVWTSSLGDKGFGDAIGLSIRESKMATGIAFNPHQAMSCRCAKIQYDANGNEIGRYDPNAIVVPQDALQKASNTFTQKEINNLVEKDKLSVYPNPVQNILHIDAKDDKDYHYQIYSLSGQMVKQGKFENKQTDLSSLISGLYLIRINNSKTVVKIIKK